MNIIDHWKTLCFVVANWQTIFYQIGSGDVHRRGLISIDKAINGHRYEKDWEPEPDNLTIARIANLLDEALRPEDFFSHPMQIGQISDFNREGEPSCRDLG